MPTDNRNNPPKPNTNKDQKISDLPSKKAGQKDQNVKGGVAKPGGPDSEPFGEE